MSNNGAPASGVKVVRLKGDKDNGGFDLNRPGVEEIPASTVTITITVPNVDPSDYGDESTPATILKQAQEYLDGEVGWETDTKAVASFEHNGVRYEKDLEPLASAE